MNKKIFITIFIAIVLFIWIFRSKKNPIAASEPPYIPKPALLANFVSPVIIAFDDNRSLLPKRNWQVANLEIDAKSALSVSFDGSRTYYEKNSQSRLPMASLTKLMTALVVVENYNLDDKVTVLPAALTREGERGDLRPYEVLTVRSLLSMMLVNSSNDAAIVLAMNLSERLEKKSSDSLYEFVNLMNQKAQELGLTNTHFDNPDGLDSPNHYSTAIDLASLLRYLLIHYPWTKDILHTQNMVIYSADGKIEHRLKNSNYLLPRIPEIQAGKTGFTDNAGGCLILFVSGFGDIDKGVITVALGSPDRFGESEKLINWLRASYIWQ